MRFEWEKINEGAKQQNIIVECIILFIEMFSGNYLNKKITTTPSRTQSPDFLSGNRISPTENIKDFKYVQRQKERQVTPIKSEYKKVQLNTQADTKSRYYQNNRSVTGNKNRSLTISHEIVSQTKYPHSCVPSYDSNEEVLHEMKSILSMMNGVEVAPFEIQNNEDFKKQIAWLINQNNRLKAEAKERDRNKRKFGEFDNDRGIINELRRQMEINRKDYDEIKQQLYRTNKTLTSQVKTLQDRARSLQREKNKLQEILIQKQADEKSQLRNSNINEKQTLTMIKQKHSKQIKSLQENITTQVNNRLKDYEYEISEYKIRLDTMQERLKYFSRLNEINQRLRSQNIKLQRQGVHRQVKRQNKDGQQIKKLMKENRQLQSYMNLLNKQVEDLKREHKTNENQIRIEAEHKVQQLILSYESSIKILKKEKGGVEGISIENSRLKYENERIKVENDRLVQQRQQNCQEVVKIRNLLAEYSANKLQLEGKVRFCEQEIERLNLKISNDQMNLANRSYGYEQQNQRLRRQVSQKELSYRYLKSQNEQIHSQIQFIKKKCNNMMNQNQKLTDEFNKIQRQSVLRQGQVKSLLGRSMDEQKNRYQNEINDFLLENRKLVDEVNRFRQQNVRLENWRKDVVENELKQKDMMIRNHQLTIRNLGKIVEESQEKLENLESICKYKNDQNDQLSNSLKLMRLQNEQKLKKNREILEREIQKLRRQHQTEIERLNHLLREKQQIEQNNILRINSKLLQFKNQSLKKELEELKRMVNEGRFEKVADELLKLSENYERELIRSEQKTFQIEGLIKDKCALSDKVADLEKMKFVLEEKVKTLINNINILENELKQRKSLCESLLNQKVLVEKQNIMLKKIKLDKETIEVTKAKAREISNKIDQLLAMQDKRENDYLEASVTFSQMVNDSTSRRV